MILLLIFAIALVVFVIGLVRDSRDLLAVAGGILIALFVLDHWNLL